MATVDIINAKNEKVDSLELPAAIFGAVAAGRKGGGFDDVASAQKALCGIKAEAYRPVPARHKTYMELYGLYRELHDAFGSRDGQGQLYHVMKDLIAIRNRQRR